MNRMVLKFNFMIAPYSRLFISLHPPFIRVQKVKRTPLLIKSVC